MSEFKIGDVVELLVEGHDRGAIVGKHYTVVKDSTDKDSYFCKDMVELTIVQHRPDDFRLVETLKTNSIARPTLEERKVGKVQMHMVQDGFPRALKHIAEIMGWAAEVKQYKLHDWRNLPNAHVEFPSAGYRHGNENSIQKSEGLPALERKDHESGKLHLGHEIFNKIAELELILAGVIK